jgi:sigma-B regulation protein RsbU (phosphoserine phosphatase)
MADMTLIVSECNQDARDLSLALAVTGIPAQMRAPHAVMADWWPTDCVPDVLLVDATLGAAVVRELVERVGADADRPPVVLCFSQPGCQHLASSVAEGLDYLVAPFHPHLVRSRLATSRRQRDLRLAMRQMRVAASRRRYEHELKIGREIQRGFLPESLPVIQGWDIAAHFAPAREVGGDFYDAYDIINGSFLGFAIADVCDKGIGAALFMALIRSLLRQATMTDTPSQAEGRARPRLPTSARLALRAVSTTNDYLTANHLHQAYFATLFFGVVDPRSGRLVYINCGHNPPIIRRSDGEQSTLPPTGPALGLMHDARFGLGHETLHHGDLLFLYTDGVPEAKSPHGDFLGEQQMRDALTEPGSAVGVVDRFARVLDQHVGAAEQFDDVTMLGLLREPTR